MNYTTVFFGDLCGLEKFVLHSDDIAKIALLEFTDETVGDVLSAYRARQPIPTEFYCLCLGENGIIYTLTDKGLLKSLAHQGKKFRPDTVKKDYFKFLAEQKKIERDRQKAKRLTDRYPETTAVPYGFPLPRFRGYKFIDKKNENTVPFRFRRAQGDEKRPLVIFFHGAGSIGNENLKQLLDAAPVTAELRGENCHYLLPQAPFRANRWNRDGENTGDYILCLENLIDYICKTERADADRVYIIGTSFGGGVVWELIYRNPRRFACAIPVVGLLIGVTNPNNRMDLSRLANENIWVAHASDDNNVPIAEDDYCVTALKELGANIKYTRRERGGHAMSTRFYRDEPWKDWMFLQRRK